MKKKRETPQLINREKPILMGFVVQRKGIDGKMEISVRWGRLAVAFLFIAVLGWLSLAGAFYAHFKYNKNFDEVSYVKMLTLLPFGIDEHRVEMGNFQIEKGLNEMRAGNYKDAFRLLRLGVARAPSNLEGRSFLAEFYEIALKRHDIAADQLMKGLEKGGLEDPDYLKRTLKVLLDYQMDEDVQNLADEHLPDTPELTDTNRILAFGAAKANYFRGNYDRADDYLTSYELMGSLDGIILSSQISWDRGNRMAAIENMEDAVQRYPDSEPLLMQLSRYHRKLGQIDEARRYAILRNVSDPLSPAPRIELLYIYNKSGDLEREQRETQRMLQQFRNNEVALQSLANFAASTGNIDLARRTYEEALENEFSIDAFALLLVEAHLVSEDYEGALEFAGELLKERPDWLTDRWAIFNSLRAVASYAIDRPDLGEIYLQDFANDAATQPKQYLTVAHRFTSIERHQQARKVLMIAYQKAQTNQEILSELIRTELTLGNTDNLNTLLTKFLEMRRPQMDIILEAYEKLGSDRFIFTPDRESLLLQLSAILRENSQTLPVAQS